MREGRCERCKEGEPKREGGRVGVGKLVTCAWTRETGCAARLDQARRRWRQAGGWVGGARGAGGDCPTTAVTAAATHIGCLFVMYFPYSKSIYALPNAPPPPLPRVVCMCWRLTTTGHPSAATHALITRTSSASCLAFAAAISAAMASLSARCLRRDSSRLPPTSCGGDRARER